MPFGPQNCAFFGDVGVDRNDVQREVDLVDHALTGAVPARKEFEVLKPVVLPVSVDVMDGFFVIEFPSKVLGHDVAVFHDGARATGAGQGRHRYPYVTVALYVLFVLATLKASLSDSHLSGYFAFLGAAVGEVDIEGVR